MITDDLARSFGRWTRPSAVVGAEWSLDDVGEALQQRHRQAVIAIRRWHPERLLWYVFPAGDLTDMVNRARLRIATGELQPDVTLGMALGLREDDADASVDVDLDPIPDDFSGVLTSDDDAVIIYPGRTMVDRTAPSVGAPSLEERRVAYGYLDAPVGADVGQEFELRVGISGSPTANVASTQLRLPAGEHVLDVTVVAEGFAKRHDESWRQPLLVRGGTDHPSFVLHLTAAEAGLKQIAATYAYAGQPAGYAHRLIMVGSADSPPVLFDQEPGRIAFETAARPADLTIEILNQGGVLHWNFQTPHDGLKALLPREAIRKPLSSAPEALALDLLKAIPANDASSRTGGILRGVGTALSDEAPTELWPILKAIPRAANRVPTLLILTNEPFLPWELALVEPAPDPSAPPFLGAQYDIGRWVLAQQHPKSPPPDNCFLGPMTVFWGQYEGGRWRALPEAELEASELVRLYQARRVEATEASVTETLSSPNPPEVIHFAGHGQYGGGGAHGGLILGDGATLMPIWVRALRFSSAPFVFLNACEAAVAEPNLSLFTGMPPAFLRAGAAAVVAPIWKVNDAIARKVALQFYSDVKQGKTASAALRGVRRDFQDQATYLAYQLFGHPSALFSAAKA